MRWRCLPWLLPGTRNLRLFAKLTDNVIWGVGVLSQGRSESLSERAVETPSITSQVGVTDDVTVCHSPGFLMWEWRGALFQAVAPSFGEGACYCWESFKSSKHERLCANHWAHFHTGLLSLCCCNRYHRAQHFGVSGMLVCVQRWAVDSWERRPCAVLLCLSHNSYHSSGWWKL